MNLQHNLAHFDIRAQTVEPTALTTAGVCYVAGILIFSGLLYAIVLTGVKPLGAVVPLGGIAFIVGWIALAVAGWQFTAGR